MCNDYEQHVAWKAYCDAIQTLELRRSPRSTPQDLAQADDIRINDLGPAMRLVADAIELTPMRFGFPPANPMGGPVFNFKSEGRRFRPETRCLIPASAFFEFTGKKYPRPNTGSPSGMRPSRR